MVIEEELKSGQLKNSYLLFGEENYLKIYYKNRLKSAIIGEDDVNFSYFEGKGIDVDEVIAIAETLPFFAEKRCVIVENSEWFLNGNEKMGGYIENLPETTCLIFIEGEKIDKRKKLYKKLSLFGTICECKRMEPRKLRDWTRALMGRMGKNIRAADLDLFLSYVGNDLQHITTEVEKLVAYIGEAQVIERSDIEDITTVGVENKIFDMLSAIVQKKIGVAMHYYEDLLILREPPMRILSLLSKQFNQLLQVRQMQGMDKYSIGNAMNLQPYIAEKLMRQASAFSKEELQRILNGCLDMEMRVKTGLMPEQIAVELLIMSKEQIKG